MGKTCGLKRNFFAKPILSPGANVIKLFAAVIYESLQ